MFNLIWHHLTHSNGTKDYDAVLINNELYNQTVLILRWGRVGNIQGYKVQKFDYLDQAKYWLRKKLNDKTGNGYSSETFNFSKITDAEVSDRLDGVIHQFSDRLKSDAKAVKDFGVIGLFRDDNLEPESVIIQPDDNESLSKKFQSLPDHYGMWR